MGEEMLVFDGDGCCVGMRSRVDTGIALYVMMIAMYQCCRVRTYGPSPYVPYGTVRYDAYGNLLILLEKEVVEFEGTLEEEVIILNI
jgi:hypothetical protein